MDKNYILDEIKRTTNANNGTPPGRRKFEKETGIKETDWFGKYWAKWSDAITEAGFPPNQLQRAYGEEVLIEKFIELIKELKRYPVRGDVRLKSYNDPGFPDSKTFERRGSKTQFATKIADYCRSHEGLEAVLEICEAEIIKNQLPSEDDNRGTVELGFVYLFKAGRFYKIGRSNAAGRRERELAIQLPEKANTVHIIRTDDPVGIEAYWHNRFETKRKRGEWFELDGLDIKAFKRRKSM